MAGRSRLVLLLGVVLVAVCSVAACSATGSTTAPVSASSSQPPTPAPTPTVPATPVATTATDWGPILDAVPASFPRYPGANDTTANGAVSAALTTSASVASLTSWYGSALGAMGFTSTSTSRPAEDGSVVAEYDGSTLAAGCRSQLSFRPQGTQTLVTVLYGAACPSG
jgi:hypothetical protein